MNNFNALDIFKLVPVGVSGLSFYSIGAMVNPIMYTSTQMLSWSIIGGLFGGLWSVVLLGGFAKEGNISAMKKWSIILAFAWALDAPMARGLYIDIVLDPHYNTKKEQYLLIEGSVDTQSLEKELSTIKIKIREEKLEATLKNKKNIALIAKETTSEYLTNRTVNGWWSKKARQIGYIKTPNITNKEERANRISALINYNTTSFSKSDKLLTLENSRTTVMQKLEIANNSNTSTSNKNEELKNYIHNIESKSGMLWIWYIGLFFFGWIVEITVPHLKYWIKWENHTAKKKNKTTSAHQEELSAISNKEIRESVLLLNTTFNSVLSSNRNSTSWIQKVLGNDAKVSAKINTFFAISLAIKNKEEKLTIANIGKYSIFKNQTTGKTYSVVNHATKILKVFDSNQITYNNMREDTMADILRFINREKW